MGIPRKENVVVKFLKQPATYDFVVAIAAAVVAFAKDQRPLIRGASLLIAINSIIKAFLNISKAFKESAPHELEGCLQTMHGFLSSGRESDCKIRIAIHVPICNGQYLEQITEYVGDKPDHRVGRRFPAQSGVIGHALRMREPVVATRKNGDYEKYIRELVEEWHYTEADARKCNPSTMSCAAIPLGTTEIYAIVYIDTNRANVISDQFVEDSSKMCAGIARFIGKRYKP